MRRLALIAALAALAGAVTLAGCAGYRGGWASVPYTGDRPPHPTDLPESARLFDLEEVKVPGTRLRVSLNNRLRTYDYQVWFAVVPVSGDPRDALLGDQDGRTRVYLSVTPQTAGFVFRGSAARLEVDGRAYVPVAARRFGQFDAAGNLVERGGKWQYVELGPEFALTQPGTIAGPGSRDREDLDRSFRSAARSRPAAHSSHPLPAGALARGLHLTRRRAPVNGCSPRSSRRPTRSCGRSGPRAGDRA